MKTGVEFMSCSSFTCAGMAPDEELMFRASPNNPMPDLRTLAIFVKVPEKRSFVRAFADFMVERFRPTKKSIP